MNRLTPFFLRKLLRWLLPAALLLAQHGVWAHGFTHDLAKIAGHSQAAGDAMCAALPVFEASPPSATAPALLPVGRSISTFLPYASHAPPLFS
jgi:phytoene dehydrogenase-like protein